jgi:hypothetical protein
LKLEGRKEGFGRELMFTSHGHGHSISLFIFSFNYFSGSLLIYLNFSCSFCKLVDKILSYIWKLVGNWLFFLNSSSIFLLQVGLLDQSKIVFVRSTQESQTLKDKHRSY